MVKSKTGILQIFTGRPVAWFTWVLPTSAVLTIISSWFSLFNPELVERWYARGLFPLISRIAGWGADAVSIAWLDVFIPVGLILLVAVIRGRKWRLLINTVAGVYLVFFWTWGLNYHRQPLISKLDLDTARTEPEAMEQFARHAASELNRLYVEKGKQTYDEARIREEAARRVRRVVSIIDGSDWTSAKRVKVSWLGNPWLHAAGIDGLFNPLAHEPIVSNTVLEFERPFVVAHELAHVRGYPDEGDANVIALLASLMSNDVAFQYSGWLDLWLYIRTPELDKLLDPGPRRDIQLIFQRAQTEQIQWINNFQRNLLDMFLKANSIDEGVRSYSRVVLIAAGTQQSWERYR